MKSEMKICFHCKHFKYETADGDGWCSERNKRVFCDHSCESFLIKYDSFAQRCMDLPYGFDNTLCDGKTCARRRKCIRYMLHVKKRLTATSGAAYYMMCAPKYNFELCFWNYYERHGHEKQNV